MLNYDISVNKCNFRVGKRDFHAGPNFKPRQKEYCVFFRRTYFVGKSMSLLRQHES